MTSKTKTNQVRFALWDLYGGGGALGDNTVIIPPF